MSKERAREYFMKWNGLKRLNCSQAIVKAYGEKFYLPDEMLDQFSKYGRGKAPEGYCGAFYAAKVILEDRYPENIKYLQNSFEASAGSAKCKDIKSHHRLSCVECVEKAAECLDHC